MACCTARTTAAGASSSPDIRPRRSRPGWENGVVGTVDGQQLLAWDRLHRGMAWASAGLESLTLRAFRDRIPVIRRFSYTLP